MRTERFGDNVTLYLADCREVVGGLVGIGSVITDPPYGMEFRSNYRTVKYDHIEGDAEEWPLPFAISLPATHSTYVFCRWNDLPRVKAPKSFITWAKNNWSMGDLEHEHARQTEFILFYPGVAHSFPHGRPTDFIEAPRTGNHFHPTEKPVMLMDAICRWTRGTILDPFMGSGSTGIGAVRTNRPFIGIEIDERYFDAACKRFEDALTRPQLI